MARKKLTDEERKERRRERNRAYYAKNRERECERAKGWYEENKERRSNYQRSFRKENPEHVRERDRRYYKKHKKWYSEYAKDYQKKRRKEDPAFRLVQLLRSRLNKAIKNNQKTGSAVRDLGCTIEEFKAYIESKWLPGMSWENWGHTGDVWHLDHIIPLSSFDLIDPEQVKLACHFSNIQPLWAVDNLKKGARC